MLSRPKDTKERRCLNYLSSFFDKYPLLYNEQRLYSDTALMYLMNRQKEVREGKRKKREREKKKRKKKKKRDKRIRF